MNTYTYTHTHKGIGETPREPELSVQIRCLPSFGDAC